MALERETPYGNFNFLVDMGTGHTDGPDAGFAEVVLPEASIDVIEYRTGNDRQGGFRKLPGQTRYSNFVLKRGVIGTLDLYQWWDEVRNGSVTAARVVLVQLLNEDRTQTVLTWKLLRAWPVRYRFAPLRARGKRPLLEYLELAFDRLEIE